MKTKTSSPSLSQGVRLLFTFCAMLASGVVSLSTAAAQNNYQTIIIPPIPTDADITIQGTRIINDTLIVNSISLDASSTLIVDGTLTVKGIISLGSNATMILDPDSIVDLGGSTLTVSSLTLADGTELTDNQTLLFGFNSYGNTFVSILKNGAGVINGTVTLDSTQPNALHLVESNEHSSDQGIPSGTITLSPMTPSDVSTVSFTSPSSTFINQQ